MRLRARAAFAVVGVALACGLVLSNCGGSSESPSGVGGTLAVSLPSVVAIAETIAGTATAHGVTVNGAWHSTDPTIATVSASGRVTGVRTGQTTIVVTYRG